MDRKLQLQADLKDNASPKIRQLGKELKEIRQTPGMEATEKWFVRFNEGAGGFVRAGGQVSGVMGAMGLGGLAAAAGLGELVEQFKALGDHTFALRRLAQESKLTIDQLRQWEYVGQVFRVPKEDMDAALKDFSDKMVDFNRRRGELFGQLAQQDPKFAEKLLGEGTEQRLQDILGWLSQVKDAAVRNRWAKEFFGTDEINSLLTSGLPAVQQAMREAKANVASLPDGFQEKADALNRTIVGFDQAWDRLKVEVGPLVFDQLKMAADDFRAVFGQIEGAIEWLKGAKDHPGDALKQAGDAADKAFNDKANEVGERWRERMDALKPDAAHSGVDGNKLHGDDSHRPVRRDGSGWLGNVQHVADVTWTGGGASGTLSDGVKEGVLAAFREWAQMQDVGKASGSGGGGFQNASFETGDGGAGVPGGRPFSGGAIDGADLSGGDVAGEHADYIRQLARKYRIDPRLAVAVANSEGLHGFSGDNNTSWGDFQLHRGGLADLFEKQTGLRANDPANWRQADEWALKYAAGHGWHDWHGARRIGVTGMMGIGGGDQDADPGSPGRAVDLGLRLDGASRDQAARALGARLTPGEWCADFVNGALHASGMKGVNSSIANAFLGWGHEVSKEAAHKGDVLVENRGGGVGMPGGHVGLFTGRSRMRNGRLQMEMLSGNYGNHVQAHDWVDGDRLHVRRGIEDLVGEARKANADREASASGSIEAHIHVQHDGSVRGARARSSGAVATPRIQLRRGPTMTQPSIDA